MAYTTFSQTKNDQLKEPMFFGQPVNVARYDQQKYDIFEKLIEKQLSFFWRPEEVDVSRDRIDYQALPEHEKHIFISNLKYQTLLDSIQGRSPKRGTAAADLDPGTGDLGRNLGVFRNDSFPFLYSYHS